MVYCGGGTSAGSTHSAIIWNDAKFSGRTQPADALAFEKVTLYEDHLDLDIRTAGVEQILEELDYEDHD